MPVVEQPELRAMECPVFVPERPVTELLEHDTVPAVEQPWTAPKLVVPVPMLVAAYALRLAP